MIITLKGADFSQNNIGKIIDYSEAKQFLTAHYPSHADNTSAEALQVFWNTLGKGTSNSIYERLRWLLMPIFGNSVTEDLYDAKNEIQGETDHAERLTHLRRGVVLASNAYGPTITGLSDTADTERGAIFYVKEALGSQYVGSGSLDGALRTGAVIGVNRNLLSNSVGGTSINGFTVADAKIVMTYNLGESTNSVMKVRTESEENSLYMLQDLTTSQKNHSKKLVNLCSSMAAPSSDNCNTTNPVMMIGSVKNMTDADATTLINAITTLRSALNV